MATLRSGSKPLARLTSATNLQMIALTILSIGLMLADQRTDALNAARGWLTTLVYPLQYVVQLPLQVADTIDAALTTRQALDERIRQLEQRQLMLNVQLKKLTAVETENRRLRLLLESSAKLPERVLIAELLEVDIDPYRHRILLDKGWRDGVRTGQSLLTPGGIVGQIVKVSPLTSRAILITDANHALPIQIERTGQRSLAQGTGNFSELHLLHLPNDNDVRVGDAITSSGLGGRFPGGYSVATVTRVEFDPGRAFARIVVTPTAALDRIREVLVVIGDPLLDSTPAATPNATQAVTETAP